MRTRAAIGLSILVASTAGFGAETDNLTFRFLPLKDSAPEVNRLFNDFLQQIAEQTNARLKSRGEPVSWSDTQVELEFAKTYRDAMMRRFEDRLVPVFGACIETNACPGWPRFERITLTRSESTYGEAHYNRVAIVFLAPTINLCGVRVGTDKFTHLFSNGFYYYNASRQKETRIADEQDVYRMALIDEEGLMGGRSTEVVSPADADATRAGYRLGTDYFLGKDPIFARNDRTGLLVKRRDVDVCRYVSPDWDEVVNPPSFTARSAKVQRLYAAIAARETFNQRAEDSMTEQDKRAMKEEIVKRSVEPGHGHFPFLYKLCLAVKYGLVYLTTPKESRQGLSYLVFPRFRLEDRRPIVLQREP